MLSKLLIGGCLMAACVAIHVAGLTSALGWFRRQPQAFWGWTAYFSCIAAWTILLHLLEITAWGLYYLWAEAIPDLASALYFSAVTYTTTGYGDVVLPQQFRLVGGIEALTGILMCGWSTGVFFTVLNRMFTQIQERR
jgi:ion channel